MKDQKKEEIIMNLVNGNRSDFRRQIKRCSKLDILDLIEYSQGQGFFKRHEIINQMRSDLEIK